MTELKPCPFCGGEAMYTESDQDCVCCCFCMECEATTTDYMMTDRAIAAWNRRASPWRSMDSAPRDGTPILAWCPNWYQGNGGHAVACYVGENFLILGMNFSEQPSHWMPLPQPPEDGA